MRVAKPGDWRFDLHRPFFVELSAAQAGELYGFCRLGPVSGSPPVVA